MMLPLAVVPPLLDHAFQSFLQGQQRWAYTETVAVQGLSRKKAGLTIVHVDPSRPYREQFAPDQIEGQSPTEKQREQYRGRGEWMARERDHAQADAELQPGRAIKMGFNGQWAVPDLTAATVVSEGADAVTYEIPLVLEGPHAGNRFDQFALSARVGRVSGEFEHATLQQRRPMHVAFVVKVSGLDLEVEFQKPDAVHPAVIARETQTGTIGLFFVKRNLTARVSRTDFHFVTPYDERFHVHSGPLHVIQF